MHLLRCVLCLCLLLAAPATARADGDQAGEFDYYVLAVSWSPNWCLREGDDRDAPECAPGAGRGWTLHGLWPQYETGWPSDCRTTASDPSRAMTRAMTDIMGSSGLAWHQWRKHGRCSGLSAADYFAASRRAYESVTRPEILRKLDRDVTLPAAVVEEAFLRENPDWDADMLTITCRDRQIQEARLCLTRDLEPRRCGADVLRDCTLQDALLTPLR
ncbi:ribonuclease T2 [Dinoroseobacter sp. PD6]|uniref:ribonuclease T2 n=1 Tax=Dinoroseobacter sp. PD6 TaxID=3028384 RepID=UPI00237BD570|nr:ribonuclease T2 [Dinoroseobacter sp. PD6]MDD9718953.1 ribonuclease T2 [Dinoroseobacter sp. PD6]